MQVPVRFFWHFQMNSRKFQIKGVRLMYFEEPCSNFKATKKLRCLIFLISKISNEATKYRTRRLFYSPNLNI